MRLCKNTYLFEFLLVDSAIKVKTGAKLRNQYNQVPHTTQDTTWKSDKSTIKHLKQEPRG